MDNNQKLESLIGTVIDGRYRVISVRGVGGMAVVLKAEDTHMHRTVALKLLSEEYSSDDEVMRRFVNESKAVALLDHEHIVSIYDVAFDQKHNYIVMEYLDGLTLKEHMMKRGKLSMEEALGFMKQILTALDHAHSKGVIHRDIKPQNIMLLNDNQVKVADFGIAKTPDSKAIATSEKAMGTVHYISPEQAAGNPTGVYSDIYSVGVMLYEMVTGRLPFEADTPLAVAMMQLNNQATPPRKIDPSIPKGLEQIILKSMAKKPADRFKSAKSMLRAIEIIMDRPNAVFEDRPHAVKNLNSDDDAAKPEKRGIFRKLFEKDSGAQSKPPRTLFPVILGVFSAFVLVAAIAGISLLLSFFNGTLSSFTSSQKVPDLIGRVYNETLVNDLNANNYTITEIIYHYDANSEPNTIILQDPAAGTSRKTSGSSKKIELTLTISMGEESIPIPDVAMFEHREAQLLLEERGLKIKVVQEYSDTVPEGSVISTSPAIGTLASAGDEITLSVSRGQNVLMGKVPNFKGLTLDEAKALANENNFSIGTITREPSQLPTDTVISQSIPADTKAAKGHTKIDLVISIEKP